MSPAHRSERLGCALRDFFFSRSGPELARAYRALAGLAPELPPLLDPDALEFAFNRLFVGPAALVAPPYASAYLEPEGLVMGEVTLRAREVYRRLGLVSPLEGALPDDHLALELDALLAMDRASRAGAPEELALLRRSFLTDHLRRWVPSFCSRVAAAPDVPEPLRAVQGLLECWLELTPSTPNEGERP